MSTYRFVRVRDVLAVELGAHAIARVTGMGTTGPTLQWRDRRGKWTGNVAIDDRYARDDLREYAELALFVRDKAKRGEL